MPSPEDSEEEHLDGESDEDLGGKSFPLDLKCFLDSSRFSDLTIKVEGRDFKVHKIVVCGQSEYFDRMFSGEWKETIDNVVTLQEDEPDAIETMINFMYGCKYEGSGHGKMSHVAFNLKVYGVADKYGVATLKQLAKERFDDAMSTYWDMDDFTHVITDVYASPQYHELQKTITQVSHDNSRPLLKKDDFLRILEETSGFAADLVRLMATERATFVKYRCPYVYCSGTWEARLEGGGIFCCLLCGNRYKYSDWESHTVVDE